MVCVGKSTSFLVILLFLPWAVRWATVVAGMGDRITGWISAGQSDVWGESVIHGALRNNQRSEQCACSETH